jgi:hypothetical protein
MDSLLSLFLRGFMNAKPEDCIEEPSEVKRVQCPMKLKIFREQLEKNQNGHRTKEQHQAAFESNLLRNKRPEKERSRNGETEKEYWQQPFQRQQTPKRQFRTLNKMKICIGA